MTHFMMQNKQKEQQKPLMLVLTQNLFKNHLTEGF